LRGPQEWTTPNFNWIKKKHTLVYVSNSLETQYNNNESDLTK
jgi:hypothetical protein